MGLANKANMWTIMDWKITSYFTKLGKYSVIMSKKWYKPYINTIISNVVYILSYKCKIITSCKLAYQLQNPGIWHFLKKKCSYYVRGENWKLALMMGGATEQFEPWSPLYFIDCSRTYWFLDKIKQYFERSCICVYTL